MDGMGYDQSIILILSGSGILIFMAYTKKSLYNQVAFHPLYHGNP